MQTAKDETMAITQGHWVATDETALYPVAQDVSKNMIGQRVGESS